MGYTDTFGNKSGSVNLGDLDRALSESANGAAPTIGQQFDGGSIGSLLQAHVSKLANYPQSASSIRDRSTHTGFDNSSSVLIGDGRTLQAYIDDLEARIALIVGAGPPTNTGAPTAPTGANTGVGTLLTANTGTWDNAVSYRYQWYRFRDSAYMPINNATASTYTIQVADYDPSNPYKIACAVAGVSGVGVVSSYVMSSLTANVTATVPSNTALPQLNYSGNQDPGLVISCSTGSWNNASTYQYQFLLDGVPFTALSSLNSFTLPTDHPQAVVTARVTAYSTLGVASAPATTSNSVTITGAVVVQDTVELAWPAHIYLNVEAQMAPATWNVTPDAPPVWDYYRVGAPQPFRSGMTTPAITFQPPGQQPPDGLVIGEQVVAVERITYLGVPYISDTAAKAVEQTPGDLTVTTAIPLTTLQVSGAASFYPVSASGQNQPFVYSMLDALPGTLSMNSGTGLITGAVGQSQSATSYRCQVQDTSLATATTSFQIAVEAAQATDILWQGVDAGMWSEINTYRGATYFNDSHDAQTMVSQIPVVGAGGSTSLASGSTRAQVQTALNNYSIVFLQAGTYNFDTTTLNIAYGKSLIGVAGATVNINLSANNSGISMAGSNRLVNMRIHGNLNASGTGTIVAIGGAGSLCYQVSATDAYGSHAFGFDCYGSTSGGNVFVSCQARRLRDSGDEGNCDGFRINFGAGGHTLIDCHADRCSDDGFDCWTNTGSNKLYFCSAQHSGKRTDYSLSAGNGNGFKMGTGAVQHKLYRCSSNDNKRAGYVNNGNTATQRAVSCGGGGNGNTLFLSEDNNGGWSFVAGPY